MAENMTLGLSPCPNDTYIFHALLHHLVPSPAHFTPHMADVEELNALARQKKLPVTKLSLGVVPYIMDDYAIMASGAALGWGCGPLVVAREDLPEEKWKTARVAVPGLMTTANLLLTLHGGFQGPREEMLFSDVMDAVLTGEADMGVIIHEGRFTYADRGLVKLLAVVGSHLSCAPAAGRHRRAPRRARGAGPRHRSGHHGQRGLCQCQPARLGGIHPRTRAGAGRERDLGPHQDLRHRVQP